MSAAVAVTGLGMVTPAGNDTASTWARLCEGRSTARTDPELADCAVSFSCRAANFDPVSLLGRSLTWRIDRFIQMAMVAAREAVADARLGRDQWDPARVGVVLGAGTGGCDTSIATFTKIIDHRHKSVTPTYVPRSAPNMAAGEICIDLGIRGPSMAIATACASGGTALVIADQLLRSGTCDIVLAGGSEVARHPLSAVAFDRMSALSRRVHDPEGASRPFDADRDGFVLGEGAAVLVLERAEHAHARRAPVQAYLAAAVASTDAHHPTAPVPDGSSAARTIGAALARAGLSPADVGHVNAHGTSTRFNDLAEARALRTVFTCPPPVTATKSVIGHAIGGAGAIEAAVSVLSLVHQRVPPTANLDRVDPDIDLDVVTKQPREARMTAVVSNSFGFGGQNSVLVFTAP
ncbi:beta-ketoacyl-[acyl-carrier-protein] synthase family protein [Kitasatospora sp. NPDC057512]|uniref:beta-ketoacyl-[acyl-carrier-protein] synthase family protein n=1 Tax=Kitasatospora sp. NPDC057512 TaxID=3346154 RepID=UPI0036B3AD30